MRGGEWGMMGGMGILGLLIWLVIFVDLVLVGVLLWQKVSKK